MESPMFKEVIENTIISYTSILMNLEKELYS